MVKSDNQQIHRWWKKSSVAVPIDVLSLKYLHSLPLPIWFHYHTKWMEVLLDSHFLEVELYIILSLLQMFLCLTVGVSHLETFYFFWFGVKKGDIVPFFFSCALLLPSSGTGEPFRRAAGQRWEEQRAPWRASRGPLPPRPTAPGPPPPPLPPPAPQLPAVVVPLMLLLLLLPLLLSVVIVVAAAAVVVVTLAVLRVAQQQEDRQCLRYLFTVGYLTDKQCRWVGLMWSRGHYYMQAHLNHMHNLHARKLSCFVFHCCPLLVWIKQHTGLGQDCAWWLFYSVSEWNKRCSSSWAKYRWRKLK